MTYRAKCGIGSRFGSGTARIQEQGLLRLAGVIALYVIAGLWLPQAATATAPHDSVARDEPAEKTALGESYARTLQQIEDIAERHYYQGSLDKALRALDSAEILAGSMAAPRSARGRVQVLRGRILVSRIFATNEGHDLARQVLQDALNEAVLRQDDATQASALDQLGLLSYVETLTSGGEAYDTARRYFEQALSKREDISDYHGVAESQFHLGLVSERLGETGLAERAYRRSLEIAVKHGLKLEQSYAVRHLAGLAASRGELDTALCLFEESLRLREEIGFRLFQPSALNSVGETLLAMQQPEKALPYFERSYLLAEGMGQRRIAVSSLLLLGDAHLRLGRDQIAHESYEHAHSAAVAIDYAVGVRRTSERLRILEQ